jgi:hypothetical protein
MFSKSLKQIALLCALVPVLSLFISCPFATSGALFLTEADAIKRSDWVVLVRATKLPRYMNFSGSNLYPITEVRCSYLKWTNNAAVGPTHYQDLWYHSGLPVGVHRYIKLPIDKFDMGMIYVQPSQDNSDADTRSLADAIIRMQLDLSLNNFVVTAVLVPEQMCQQLLSDFGAIGFHKRSSLSGPMASIHLVSNPIFYDEYLYLDR